MIAARVRKPSLKLGHSHIGTELACEELYVIALLIQVSYSNCSSALLFVLLSFSEAVVGAPVIVPMDADLPPADYCSARFEATVLEFSDEANIGVSGEWMTTDAFPDNRYALATTLAPAQITRAEKGTDNIMSGKDVFRTPEPPAIVMVLIGVGLICLLPSRRTVHRPGRRKVPGHEREMAHI